jgi:hypothetical protein
MSRDAVVAKALSLKGLSYGSDPEQYTARIAPNDSPAAAKDIADDSFSCGYTCELVMRESEADGTIVHRGQTFDGLRIPLVKRAPLGLPAVVYQETLARQRGLWVHRPGPGMRPEPGTMVHVLGPVHVLTVTGVDGDDLEVIEGGQVDEENRGLGTAIRLHHKRVVEKGGKLYLQPLDAPGQLREVWGWFQAGDLPCL